MILITILLWATTWLTPTRAQGGNGEACIYTSLVNDGGCTAPEDQCVAIVSGLKIESYADWRKWCLMDGKCLCQAHATFKMLGETGCYSLQDDCIVTTPSSNTKCFTTATGVAATAACTTDCKCLVDTGNTTAGCLKHSDCAKATTPNTTAKCFSSAGGTPGGVEITDATAPILCTQHDCVCKEQADTIALAGDNAFIGQACTNSNQCFSLSDSECYDKNGYEFNDGEAHTASLACRIDDGQTGCIVDDHCQSQLCLQYGVAGRVSAGTGGGVCVETGADGQECSFHGIADEYVSGCASFASSLCITQDGVVLEDKAAYEKSRCLEAPTQCFCHDVSATGPGALHQMVAGYVFAASGAPVLLTDACASGLAYDLELLKMADTNCEDGSTCVCLVDDDRECTASDQCLPTSTCFKHKLSSKLGICLDTEDNWNNTTLEAIETFDQTALMDKLTSVETNLASGTTAQTGTLQTAVTASETTIAAEVAKVKADVNVVNAKMALETTAAKVKKDVDDTKDKVGAYGIAAVVLVALVVVGGVVMSFSAGKGTKVRSSARSSSRNRGRRYESDASETQST